MIEWETIFLSPPESRVPCDRDFPPLALNSDILYFASSQFFVGGSGKTGAAAALENKHTASFLPVIKKKNNQYHIEKAARGRHASFPIHVFSFIFIPFA